MINALHMATIRELDDPALEPGPTALTPEQGRSGGSRPAQVESLIRKTAAHAHRLRPGLGHDPLPGHEAGHDFVAYLKAMSQMPRSSRGRPKSTSSSASPSGRPGQGRQGNRTIMSASSASQKGYDPLPYYAVMFEQPLGAGLVRRAAMVSQSPQMIQQWVQEIINPQGGVLTWQALPLLTRARGRIWTAGGMDAKFLMRMPGAVILDRCSQALPRRSRLASRSRLVKPTLAKLSSIAAWEATCVPAARTI